ncbi:penicillin-binding protein 2 [Caldicoprobacter guelmensis]|uniref:penicillin-binding transpeptidase domain-containing protein n=1 Tax=Caldicoprobacter guelmensis TaxID=1170224 RepID=UPI00195E5B3A|nr:penicillin-binding transpeptidase domain-containing protein [Caldicoprobacter guelmensis]MBM7583064.1 penicillin-binding protein 2 [Caldicoprobacter guelmensis]
MLKWFKNRFFLFGLICTLGFTTLLFRLAYLTVELGETYYALSMERKSVEIPLKGSRGNILDRNGIPMATNKQMFVVELDKQRMPTGDKQLNDLIYRVISIIKQNGDATSLMDNIPIKIDENGRFYYAWENKSPDSQKKDFERWKSEAGIRVDLPADEMLQHLRERFKLAEELPDDIARDMVSVRLDIYMNRYRPNPIRIATGVSQKTVAQLETYANELPGLQISVEMGRYYPMGDVAAHIIGYVGRISSEDIEEYRNKGIDLRAAGYDLSVDRIGKMGIEKYAEQWLTACTKDKRGMLWAEVNSAGRVVRVLSETPPEDGNDVVLTLDSRLQKAVEDILAEEIHKMAAGLPPYEGDKYAPYANRGAAVILDVHTGEILAMASYPAFDLNLFIPSISAKEYQKILNAPGKPLTAVAFQERFPLGSVIKMMVGIAGLMEGKVTLNEEIYDAYQYTKYGTGGPRCWTRPGVHGHENFVDALKHSCDYYFYELADRLGIYKLVEWGRAFGLEGHAGLEIGDVESFIGDPERRIALRRPAIIGGIKALMGNKNKPYYDFFQNVDQEKKDKLAERLADLPVEATYNDVRRVIKEEVGNFKGFESFSSDVWGGPIYAKRWLPYDTVRTGIGQTDVNVTPLAVARYIAAIANGGKVMETHVLKKVVSPKGEILNEMRPVVVNDLNIKPEYLEAARLGMYKVVNDKSTAGGGAGTAVGAFAGLDPAITVAGKTGTAQTKIIPGADKDEKKREEQQKYNVAWFGAFTPYENPEIAIVVMIPNGRTSSNAAIVARRVIEEYYRLKNTQRQFDAVDQVNQLKQ